MTKPTEPVFQNFTLVELSHPTNRTIERHSPNSLRRMIEDRLAFGRKLIDSETLPGNLILIEDPQEMTFEQYARYLENDFPRNRIRQQWYDFQERQQNFYASLAKYARKKGRIVESADTGLLSHGGRLEKIAVTMSHLPPKTLNRALYLIRPRRDKSMIQRIQRRRPTLVIVASGHAVAIQKKLKPRTIFFDRKWTGIRGFIRKKRLLLDRHLLELLHKRYKRRRLHANQKQSRLKN